MSVSNNQNKQLNNELALHLTEQHFRAVSDISFAFSNEDSQNRSRVPEILKL
jgi:hypothetical protein